MANGDKQLRAHMHGHASEPSRCCFQLFYGWVLVNAKIRLATNPEPEFSDATVRSPSFGTGLDRSTESSN